MNENILNISGSQTVKFSLGYVILWTVKLLLQECGVGQNSGQIFFSNILMIREIAVPRLEHNLNVNPDIHSGIPEAIYRPTKQVP